MNKRANHATLGVNKQLNTKNRQENDYYSTPPAAVEHLLKYEKFSKEITEPAVGGGAIAEVLKRHGHTVQAIDIIDRGYPGTVIKDFLKYPHKITNDIITNPPYNIQTEFVKKCINTTTGKTALLLKLQFLESIKRYKEIHSIKPPQRVYIFVKRIKCLTEAEHGTGTGGAVCYCWYIWNNREPQVNTIIKWIPNY